MRLKKTLSHVSEKYKEPSTCESCDEEFICGATLKGCWCMKTELTDEDRDYLKSKFKKCLCQDCLNKISKNSI